MNGGKVFDFQECVNIVKSTGKSAGNLREFKAVVSLISHESIYHHTCEYFIKGHILEYTNDFAHWAGESLGERVLSEHLSNIDPYSYRNMEDLRHEILNVVDTYLENFPEPRDAMPGDEFYFNQTVTLIFPAGVRARNLAEFLIGIKFVDSVSIYYHFYDARMRLGNGVDDFSAWLEDTGEKELAESIRAIDPFMHNVEGIRERMIEEIEKELKKDMEVV
jgi:hypothetical protein